jgi:phosphotransferase system HPr (HPr) family protein
MVNFQIVVPNEVGLHARPAADFVKTAGNFKSSIRLRKVGSRGSWMNAKSILSVLSLGVDQYDEIELQIEGEDEQEAAAALARLIESNFSVL